MPSKTTIAGAIMRSTAFQHIQSFTGLCSRHQTTRALDLVSFAPQ